MWFCKLCKQKIDHARRIVFVEGQPFCCPDHANQWVANYDNWLVTARERKPDETSQGNIP